MRHTFAIALSLSGCYAAQSREEAARRPRFAPHEPRCPVDERLPPRWVGTFAVSVADTGCAPSSWLLWVDPCGAAEVGPASSDVVGGYDGQWVVEGPVARFSERRSVLSLVVEDAGMQGARAAARGVRRSEGRSDAVRVVGPIQSVLDEGVGVEAAYCEVESTTSDVLADGSTRRIDATFDWTVPNDPRVAPVAIRALIAPEEGIAEVEALRVGTVGSLVSVAWRGGLDVPTGEFEPWNTLPECRSVLARLGADELLYDGPWLRGSGVVSSRRRARLRQDACPRRDE